MAEYKPFGTDISLKDIGMSPNISLPSTQIDVPTIDSESLFGGNLLKDLGGLEGMVSVGKMIGDFMGAKDEQKWRERAEQREERRVAREERRQEKFEGGMKSAWS